MMKLITNSDWLGVTMVQKSKRGGNVKKAPVGFYTAQQAQQRLGVTPSAFQAMVAKDEVKRVVPPTKSEGFYSKAEVDALADRSALFHLQHVSQGVEHTEFACATIDDIQGIFNVVASLWGADKATPVELRKSWYQVNNRIDYVVKFRGLVLGYVNMVPYIPETLEAMMSGRKRGWDVRPRDILPFEPGNSYDCFVGIAVLQDIPRSEYYARKLIYGFFEALCDLVYEGILIRRLFATSDQPFGIKISQDLGFEKEEPHPGDLFGRFVLDMEMARTPLILKYRQIIYEVREGIIRKPPKKASKVLYDPRLEDVLNGTLDALIQDISNETEYAHVIGVLTSLIDQLAESSQTTTEQQMLLKSIHAALDHSK